MENRCYSARITGNPFLLFETRVVANLMLKKKSKDEIRSEINRKNMFQYKNIKSITKRFNALYKRLEDLDETLIQILVEGSIQDAKLVNLLVIAKSERLFRDFLFEVVSEKIRIPGSCISEKELYQFFEFKRESIPAVQRWKEYTLKKLKQVYVRILVESGMLRDRKSKQIEGFLINDVFRQKLSVSFKPELIDCISIKG